MNRSRPVGALGGGGWEEGSQSDAPNQQARPGNQRDKVLTEMYEMFLGSLEPDIIESVVQSCGFNAKKSLETLLEMCGGKSIPSKSAQQLQSSVLPFSSPAAQMQHPKTLKTGQEENKPQPLMLQPVSSPFPEKALPASSLQSPSKVSRGVPRNSSRDLAPIPPTTLSFPYAFKKKQNPDTFLSDKMCKIRWYIENGKRIMIIMRGCPGSGKSVFATSLISSYGGKPQDFVFSTDDFFMRRDGYFFVPQNLPEAHQWNKNRVLHKLREGSSPIIIDNTNTQLWEMQVYASLAINNGYALEIMEPPTPWFKNLSELSKRNKHGVPRDKIKLMLERYESNITVDILIKSTGAQYSKPPPQTAEHALNVLSSNKHGNQDLVRTTNYTAGIVRRPEQTLSNDFRTNLGNQPTNHLAPKDQESPDSTNSIPKIDGFYFGSQALKSSTSMTKETNCIPKFNPVQSFDSFNAIKINHSFPKEFTRLPPKTCQDFNQNMKSVDSFGTSCTTASGTDVLSGNDLEPALKSEEAKASLSNAPLMPIAGENGNTEHQSEESGKDSESDIQKLIASLDCTSITLDDNKNVEHPFTSKRSEVSPKPDYVLLTGDISSDASSITCNPTERKENPEDILNSSSISHGLVEEPKRSIISWPRSSDWDESKKCDKNDNQHPSALPKPPRSFSSKSIQDYCQSVRDINTASQNDVSGWTLSENGPISWQPVEKYQEEVFRKEKSTSPPRSFDNYQQLKFRKCTVLEKSTNTHHSDFSALSGLSSNSSIKDVKVLNAHDRDINEGRNIPSSKVSIKLMLDKGTFTENDFEGVTKAESKQEKMTELSRLFPNTSQASIKELLKQCQWDVNYVSNLLLDTDNENIIPDGNLDEDSDEELEPSIQEHVENGEINDGTSGTTTATQDATAAVNIQEEAKEVIRHIEQSIDFSEGYYSPHTLAIKNLRRGQREGAIPKSSHSIMEAPSGLFVELPSDTCQASSVESPVRTSESSDGNEDNETLEFIVSHDFIQQLVDKFGSHCNVTRMSPVVKFPVSLARQIYDVIFTANTSEEEEDDGDFAMKLQCEEDERMARHMYEEMMQNAHQSGSHQSTPPLREIMDMELAQAIYKADVDSLSQNSPETMAQVLAKRLLEDNYQQVDKKTLHDIFASCNFSFEDTVKTLQEALSSDNDVFSEKGRSSRESQLMDQAMQASAQGRLQNRTSPETHNTGKENAQYVSQSVVDDVENENPWELKDPKAHSTKYRQQADEHLKRRDEMYSKASDAFKRGQRSVAAYYAKLGELNGKKYHHANAMAAATLAAAHSNSHSSDTLDLHHFKVVEAVTIFDLYIDHHIGILPDNGLQQQCLNIITGRGTHSVHGKPRIKPAILNRVKKRNLRYQPIPSNPGVIKVWVTVSSSLSHEIPD